MKNRREFLKGAATGAVLLGSQSRLGIGTQRWTPHAGDRQVTQL